MLSTTNSVNDVKAKLGNAFAYYGYADDPTFVVAIQAAIEEAKMLDLIMQVGETLYNIIRAKDKTDLSITETFIYMAETFFSASCFLDGTIRVLEQSSAGESDHLKVEGYERTTSGGSVNSGMMKSSKMFWQDGIRCLGKAGFIVSLLQRGDTALTPGLSWGR